MKKIFTILVVLLIIYIGIQLGFHFFNKGHECEYVISNGENDFNIKETFINNTKNEFDSYLFEIATDDAIFYYQTIQNFNKKNHIIENIVYYNDNEYRCILPIFVDDKIITDVLCLNDNIIYNYQTIKSQNSNIDSFVESLDQYGYDNSAWNANSNFENINGLDIYRDNILKKHHITLTTYKGLYTINDANNGKPRKIDLFTNDVYKRPLSIIFNNYYVVANYNQQYRFTKFYVIDLTSNKSSEIDCKREISFDSYIQGTNGNSIYLFDRDSKKQYEINLNTNKVSEVKNDNATVKIYRNNQWEKISITEAKNNDVLFESQYESDIEDDRYLRIDKVGGEQTGYYYYFVQNNENYEVYRANRRHSTQLTYLFNTTDINRIIYIDDYIYFLDGDTLKYFNDITGVKSVLIDKELSFNDGLIFGIYKN